MLHRPGPALGLCFWTFPPLEWLVLGESEGPLRLRFLGRPFSVGHPRTRPLSHLLHASFLSSQEPKADGKKKGVTIEGEESMG